MKRPRIILADDHTLLLDALKKLIEPEFEVVGTFADGLSLVEAAPRLGASAFLLKHSAGRELLQALREVVRGGCYITPLMTNDMEGSFVQNFKRRKRKSSLTLRQKEVLQLLAEGRSMKEVAFLLDVSLRTVAFHKYAIMDRLHVKSNAELIGYAMRSVLLAA